MKGTHGRSVPSPAFNDHHSYPSLKYKFYIHTLPCTRDHSPNTGSWTYAQNVRYKTVLLILSSSLTSIALSLCDFEQFIPGLAALWAHGLPRNAASLKVLLHGFNTSILEPAQTMLFPPHPSPHFHHQSPHFPTAPFPSLSALAFTTPGAKKKKKQWNTSRGREMTLRLQSYRPALYYIISN